MIDSDDFLEHYGKKGMKWGVKTGVTSTRKERRAAFKESKKSQQSRSQNPFEKPIW